MAKEEPCLEKPEGVAVNPYSIPISSGEPSER